MSASDSEICVFPQLAGIRGELLGGPDSRISRYIDRLGPALSRMGAKNVSEIESCPQDWLFPQSAAVVHLGDVGTLAAGILASCPTIVCATQGEQPFDDSILQNKGIGR